MQNVLTLRARGQALIETTFALPVFLVALFGIIWALQSGVLGERVEAVARYGGMVTAQGNPFDRYSFYATYQAAAGTPIAMPCPTPPPGLISNGGPVAAPATPSQPFWQPSTPATTSASCGWARAAAGLSTPKLLGRAQFSVSATAAVPGWLQSAFGGTTTTSTSSLTAFSSPDMGTVVSCYPELQTAFEATVAPAASPGAPPAPPALTLDTTPLALSANCGG